VGVPFEFGITTTSANQNFRIPVDTDKYLYNYTVDWGDESEPTTHTGSATKNYTTDKPYTVIVSGIFPYVNMAGEPRLTHINNIGNSLQSLENSFIGCINLVEVNAVNADNVLSCINAWKGCTLLDSFNAEGLTNQSLDCTDAWKNTKILWELGDDFTNYSQLTSSTVDGWSPGPTVENNSPLIISFQFTINVTDPDDRVFTIGVDTLRNYNYRVDWGDGETDTNTHTNSATRNYTTTGTYNVIVSGTFPYVKMADEPRLTRINNIGNSLQSLENSFIGCINLVEVNAVNADNVLSCINAWQGCTSLESFDTTGLTSLIYCDYAWQGCTSLKSFDGVSNLHSVNSCENAWRETGLTSFNTNGLTSLTNCTSAWQECISLRSFDVVGLTDVQFVTDAWKNTKIWTLGDDFTNYSQLTSSTVTGWSPGPDETTNSPRIISFQFTIDITDPDVEFTMILDNTQNYDYAVDWGDGTYVLYNTYETVTKNYATPGTYSVTVSGDFPYVNMADELRLTRINNIGNSLQSLESSFRDCTNLLTVNAVNADNVLSCDNAWQGCTSLRSFNAEGLTNQSISCTEAWVSTKIWELGTNFTNYSQLTRSTVSGWSPGPDLGNSPRIISFQFTIDITDLGLGFIIDISRVGLEHSQPNSTYSYRVDWGDGDTDTKIHRSNATKTYTAEGTYNVIVSGIFPYVNMAGETRLTHIIDIGNSIESLENSFIGCINLKTVNVVNADNVVNCVNAWRGCERLTDFDASGLFNVTNCDYAWQGCTLLQTFNPSGLSSATTCKYAWSETGLTSFDSLGLSSVTNCTASWYLCKFLLTFDDRGLGQAEFTQSAWQETGLTSFTCDNLYNVTECNYTWFKCTDLVDFTINILSSLACVQSWLGCTALVTFDTSGMTSNAINLDSSWLGCNNLVNFDTSGLNGTTSCNNAWKGCTSLRDFDATNIANILYCVSSWENCTSLRNFDTSKFVSLYSCKNAWKGCTSLRSFNAKGLTNFAINCTDAWASTRIWQLDTTFTNYIQLASTGVTGWSPETNNPNTGEFTFKFTIHITSTKYDFSIVLDNIKYIYNYRVDWGDGETETASDEITHDYTEAGEGTYNVIISGLFPYVNMADEQRLTHIIDIGNSLQSLDGSFKDCINLVEVNAVNAYKVSSCVNAWEGCSTSLSSFDASGLFNVTNCNNAWLGCTVLVSFNTSGLTSITSCDNAWENCTNLTDFDAKGLTNQNISCTDAWKNTRIWKPSIDFKNYSNLTRQSVNGWSPGPDDTSNPKIIQFQFEIETIEDNYDFTMILDSTKTYDYAVDWGDGDGTYTSYNTTDDVLNTYVTTGTYIVTVSGDFPYVNMASELRLKRVNNIGNSLQSLDGSFKDCTNLETVNAVNADNVLSCVNAWEGCTNLASFDASGLINLTNCTSAWQGCTNLRSFDTNGLTNLTNCTSAWQGCTNLRSFDTNGLTNLTNCTSAWQECISLRSFDVVGLTAVQFVTDAWKNTKIWTLGTDFTNYSQLTSSM
jgi:hypothetical protein